MCRSHFFRLAILRRCLAALCVVAGVAGFLTARLGIAAEAGPGYTAEQAEQALRLLKEGNQRYRESRLAHPHQSAERRLEVSTAQHPFAQILACSDSRVSPEIIFDEGLGDLFVVRVAGNIVDDAVIGSLEYGAEHLHAPLIVVLGHKSCGAVTAAVQAPEVHDHVLTLIDAILPAVLSAKNQPGDAIQNAVRANVELTVERLRRSWPTLRRLDGSGAIRILGAIYDLESGEVEWTE
jgi:carbonic anhydrase